MNTTNSSPAWRTLGDIDLPAAASTDDAIHAWLAEIVTPLNLSPDFLGMVLKSVQESVGNAFRPNSDDTLLHIHLSILVPRGHIPSGKSWGFFHIGKIETDANNSDERHHAIDFYLYVEGE